MLKTLVKVAEVVAASAALAFVVLLFFNGDDPEEVQAAPAAAFPEEAAAAIEAKARVAVGNQNGEQNGDGGEQEETTTTEAEPEGVDGAAVFADNCAQCHGDDGGGGVGPNLQDNDDAEAIVGVATNGRGGMPSFEGRLDPAEIEAVADYVANEL